MHASLPSTGQQRVLGSLGSPDGQACCLPIGPLMVPSLESNFPAYVVSDDLYLSHMQCCHFGKHSHHFGLNLVLLVFGCHTLVLVPPAWDQDLVLRGSKMERRELPVTVPSTGPFDSKTRGQVHHRPEPTEAKVLETALPRLELHLRAGTWSPQHADCCTCCLLFQGEPGHLRQQSQLGSGLKWSRNLTMASGLGSQEQKGLLIVKPQAFLLLEIGAAPARLKAQWESLPPVPLWVLLLLPLGTL